MADIPKRPATNLDEAATFPAKLRLILSNPEMSHIISWLPHGYSWKIHDPKMFVDVVMPRYFEKQSKLTSFTRQVNGWGFKRVTQGIDRNAYYNEFFLRDYPHLMNGMKRRRIGEQDSPPKTMDFNTQRLSNESPQVSLPLQHIPRMNPHIDTNLTPGDRSFGSSHLAYPPPESSHTRFLPKMRKESKGITEAGTTATNYFASYPGFQYSGDHYFDSFGYDMQGFGRGQAESVIFPQGKDHGTISSKGGLNDSASFQAADIISPIPLNRSRRMPIMPDETPSFSEAIIMPQMSTISHEIMTGAESIGSAANSQDINANDSRKQPAENRAGQGQESERAEIRPSNSEDEFKNYIKYRLQW